MAYSLDGTHIIGANPNNVVKFNRSNILSRCPVGRLIVATGNGGYTSHNVMELAGKPIAIRIGVPNLTSASPSIAGSFSFDSTFGALSSNQDKGNNLTSWTALTWNNGGTSANHTPTISASRPTWEWSDWVGCSAVDRTDGVGSILHLNLIQGVSGQDSTRHGGIWLANTTTELVAKQKLRTYTSTAANDYATTNQAGFVGALQIGGNVAAVVQYMTIIPGLTMLILGDSISSGGISGSTAGYGWHNKCRDIITSTSVPVEVCNLGWAGQTMSTVKNRYLDVADRFQEALLFHMLYTPNDAAEPMVAANVNTMKSSFGQSLAACFDNRCRPIYQTGVPANATVVDGGSGGASAKSLGVGDVYRVSYNAEISTSNNDPIIDVAGLLSGSVISSGTAIGQKEFNPAYTDDGVHPNTVGEDVWASSLATTLKSYI